MKRWMLILLVVALVAGVGVVGYGVWNRRAQAQTTAIDGERYTVIRGEVAEVVEATGALSPATQAQPAFAIGGEIVEVAVVTGDWVEEGDLLARLDTQDLALQVEQAEAGLASAQANLQRLLAEARPEDVQIAESNLAQAQINAQEQRTTLAASTEQARLSWIQAANALRDAQAAYENIYWDNREAEDRLRQHDQELPDSAQDAEAQAWRTVENAEAAMEQARLAYEQAQQRQESSVAGAWTQVEVAQANLDRLAAGASSEEIAAAQASVDQAQVSLEMAQAQLERCTLTAPFDGLVSTVLAERHQQVTAGTPILILVDPTAYTVDVQVDEVDVVQVAVDQEAYIWLDAQPEIEMAGQVTEMAFSPATGGGVVTYRVQVSISELGTAAARPGMTANVSIVTARAEDVLVVPRRAVRLENGQAYVQQILATGETTWTLVELGLGDSYRIEIRAGLEEGDQIVVPSVVQRNQLQELIPQQPGSGVGRQILGGGE